MWILLATSCGLLTDDPPSSSSPMLWSLSHLILGYLRISLYNLLHQLSPEAAIRGAEAPHSGRGHGAPTLLALCIISISKIVSWLEVADGRRAAAPTLPPAERN